jgi:hypothetical protein
MRATHRLRNFIFIIIPDPRIYKSPSPLGERLPEGRVRGHVAIIKIHS